MSALWTAPDVAAATGGRACADWQATGISIDSRTAQPGDLFIALEGPTNDGHDYVAMALERGAAAAMVARPVDGVEPAKLVLVGDTQSGLEALAAASRRRFKGRLIGITGSVGKTGSKAVLATMLRTQGTVHASAKSHNNHWGVPLTLAAMPQDADFAVIEMGMNHAGEIRALTRQARPHGCLITAIAPAHLGHFQDVAGIAAAKAEIFVGVEPGGFAVIPADSPHTPLLQAAASAAGIENVFGFGEIGDAVATAIQCGDVDSRFEARLLSGTYGVDLRVPGRHWVNNTLGLLLVGEALGLSVETLARALHTVEPEIGRGQRHRIALGDGAATLIDDSYNANPASMTAALDVLGRAGGRRLAALGEMKELGASSPSLHKTLAEPIAAAACARVFTSGADMAALAAVLPSDVLAAHADDADELIEPVRAELRDGDTLLVKGSLASGMGRLVDALLDRKAP